MTSRTSTSSGRRRIAGAAVLAALLFTSACTGVNAGQGTPSAATSQSLSASASATASATPTPTASYRPADASGKAQNVPVPVLPEVAKTETKEGLEAFARYWFELLNFAYETGNPDGVESVSSPACELCSNIARSLLTNYEGDRWLAGGKIEVPSVSTTFEAQPDRGYQVVVQVQQSTISYFGPGGTEFRKPTPSSDTGNVMLAAFKDGAWQVTGLHQIR